LEDHMTVTGPDFFALQVRDLDRSAEFYETRLGLRRLPTNPPGAIVFDTTPISFAVREPLPGIDLDAASPRPGLGVALWLHTDDAQALHDQLTAAGVPVPVAPFDGPFGRTFTFIDPDGYAVTIHDQA
jgi:predicted enzyme related to lactoylglutathione lyase